MQQLDTPAASILLITLSSKPQPRFPDHAAEGTPRGLMDEIFDFIRKKIGPALVEPSCYCL